MRLLICFIGALVLQAAAVFAQQPGTAWLGAEVQDLSKAEAETLGWEEPRGAKVVRIAPRSPAVGAGLQPRDIVVSLDGFEIENAQKFLDSIGGKAIGAEVRLSVRRDGREKRLTAVLRAPPAPATANADARAPQLMLDTGGHMALIRSIAFTPDGRELVSASDDKTIRVWDLETGRTLRTIRGEAAPGDPGKNYAMALSPDGKWLAAGAGSRVSLRRATRCGFTISPRAISSRFCPATRM
ncbi:MAG: PDZ domain-containing protein [Rhodomicrobium sp.]|nr:PDZ domain-containing protein [Rhodomicrobium sp.]